jgi:hypothetical protein
MIPTLAVLPTRWACGTRDDTRHMQVNLEES